METFMSLVVGIFFFASVVVAYCMGIKHGRIIKDGGVPNINPVSVYRDVLESKESKKQMDLFSEGISNILNFGEMFDNNKKT